MSGTPLEQQTVPTLAPAKVGWAEMRRISDSWQRVGMNGDAPGIDGVRRRTFAYGFAGAAVFAAGVCTMNVISDLHEPGTTAFRPVVAEVSSWLTAMSFFWIVWVGYRLAPPFGRPRWKLLIHLPMALTFMMAHVSGFLILRKLAYALAGLHYVVGSLSANFAYEIRKDAIGYALFIGGLTFIERMLRQQQPIVSKRQSSTIDVRDGARLSRIRLDEVLAIGSAGNYVEFILRDGRKLMMRSPLSAVEAELRSNGFVRTHRSWVVNSSRVTGLRREGYGDYTVEIDSLTVPLSRRFPQALARLKDSGAFSTI